MKKFIKEFVKRGLMWCWGGPAILGIIWFILGKTGNIVTLTVNEAVLSVLSSIVMAFIAAGISVVYETETLPLATATLIQMAVLYVDYLGVYLLNGWILVEHVLMFTAIFIIGFIAIWAFIYFSSKAKVDKLNKKVNQ